MAQAQFIAKVSSISGEAFARDSSGTQRRLKAGDFIRDNETVVAADGSQVLLKLADGRDIQLRPGETLKLDSEVVALSKPDAGDSALAQPAKSLAKIAKALSRGDNLDTLLDDEAPAAGGVAAGGNEGHTFVELLRIVEAVDAQGAFQLANTGNRLLDALGNEQPILGSSSAITVIAPDNTNDNTPTITGQTSLLPGGSIVLSITDGAGALQTVSTTVRSDGSFSIEVPQPLSDGNYTVTASGRDLAGNTGSGSDNGSVDTAPPLLAADLDPASDSGTKNDHITNDTTPSISGRGEAGARIEVEMPGTGEKLSTVVQADGTWSVTPNRPIADGTNGQARVSETDSAGNVSTTTVDLHIDTTPPAVRLSLDANIAGDGMVNKNESNAAAIPLSGTVSGEFHIGDTVIVTVNGREFNGQVDAAGRFTVQVPGADLAADTDRQVDARLTTSDAAGNSSTVTASQSYLVSTHPPVIAISLDAYVAGDGIVNKLESTAAAIPVSGTVSGTFQVGDTVTVRINDKDFTTSVLAGGRFSVDVPGADLAADADLIVEAQVTTTDTAGNSTTAKDTQNYTLNTSPPSIAISLDAYVAGDGIVNKLESTAAAIPVTGTVSGAFNVGDTVTVRINDHDYQTGVLAGGRFSVNVLGADLVADSDQVVEAQVTTTDAAGNSSTARDTQNYTVNTNPPAIAISLDANVAGDGIVNKLESTATAIPVTGTVSGAFNVGDTVTVRINGQDFTTGVLAGGRFTVDVPGADLAADSDRIVEAWVTTTDAAGNSSTARDTQNYTVNTSPPAIAISLDANVAGDGIVNKLESTAAAIPVTGTVSGAFNVGDTVTVRINGRDFTTGVLPGGRFSVDVPGADLAADSDRIVEARVSTTDAAGNSSTASDTQNYTVNTSPPAIAISLDANVAGDGIVNNAESTAAAIPVTGTVSGAFNVGDTVTVRLNNHEFTTRVLAGGRFSVDVPGADLAADADRTIEARVTTTDAAGNTASASDTQDYRLATDLPKASIALDANFAGDGIINLNESTAPAIAVRGTVGGDVKLGDPVVVSVNGHDYQTTVIQRGPGVLGFTVDVAGSELAADADATIDARVTTTDGAGNQISNSTSLRYDIDTTPPLATIALDANFGGDGIINLDESTAPAIPVSGTVGGDAQLGDRVVVSINGHDYQTTVIQRAPGILGFTVDVPGGELNADPDQTIEATLSVSDRAGNLASYTTSLRYEIDTTPPLATIALDANFGGDGIINLDESTAPAIPVSGTVGGDARLGDPVVVSINGQDYRTTVIQRAPGVLGFTVDVPGSELNADPDRTIEATLSVSDRAGNEASYTTSLGYDIDTTPPLATIALDANLAGDGIINITESTRPAIPVSGTVGGDAKLGDAVVVRINNHDYQTTVIERAPGKLGFTVNVAGSELIADADQTIEARVAVSDRAGNHATYDTAQGYAIDTTPPAATIKIDANFGGDGIINLAESTAPAIPVSGTVGGDAKIGDPVLVSINGHDYSTTVIERAPGKLGFSVDVPGSQLAADPDQTIDASVTVSDRAGNTATVETSLTYTLDTTPPTFAGTLSLAVSEAGLLSQPANATATGKLAVSDDGGLHLQLVAPTTALSSGGVPIVWTTDGSGHELVGHLGSASGEAAIRISLLDDQGNTRVQLLKPIDHAASGAEDDLKSITVGITATDDAGNTSPGKLQININDDAPSTTPSQVIHPHSDGGIQFTLPGENTPANHNVAPNVHAFSHSLLGLIGLEALNLIDVGGTTYLAKDGNNNITRVVIESGSLLSINLGGSETLSWSQELAAALGLRVELVNDSGLLDSHFTLTISSLDPAHPVIDNLSINELLSTLRINDAALNINLLNSTTITATDAYGASDTASLGTLVDLSLLNSTAPASVQAGTNGNDTLDGSAQGDVMLGGTGQDSLLGNAGRDMLHGGAGDDRLDGGADSDLLVGGAGNDLLHGGDGQDVFSWNLGDRGAPGSPAVDSIDDFGNGRDIIRITNLLASNGVDAALPHDLLDYVYLEKTATGDAILHISSTGGFAAGYAAAREDQTIVLKGYGAHLSGDSEYDLRSLLDSHQLVIGDSSPSTAPGGSSDAQGSLGSFGADGGHVARIELGGYTYSYDAASNSISRSGSSTSVGSHAWDATSHVLTIHTTAGETIAVDLDDATYSYTATTPLSRDHYTAVGYTLVDNDGDTASSTLRFMGTAPAANVAPTTDIETSNNLLGIIGLGALDVIDLGTRQAFMVADANNNLAKVEIRFSSLLALGAYDLTASMALARELGLRISIVNDPATPAPAPEDLSLVLLSSSTMTITAADGGAISNVAINEFLGSVHFSQTSLLDAKLLNNFTITATDMQGLSHTSNDFTLLDVNLLNNGQGNSSIHEGSAATDSLTGSADSDRLYGYAGNDSLNAGDGNDLVRGGSGDDRIDGGNGNDLLIGGAGNDLLFGGSGSDVFRWEFADNGSSTMPAVDIVMDFNSAPPTTGGDVLDLRDLLQGEFHDGIDLGNLESYLHFSRAGSDTVIDIRATGAGTPTSQQIILHDADLSQAGALISDAQIIQNLLQNGKLLTD